MSPQGLTNHFLHYTTCANIHASIVTHLAGANQEGNDGVGGAVVPSTASVIVAADPCADSDSDDENALFDFVEDYPANEVMPAIENTAEAAPAVAALGAQGVFAGVRVLGHLAGVVHTVDEYAEIQLLKMMNDGNVPHYLFKDVLEWAADSKRRGYLFQPTRTSRPAHLISIENRFALQSCRPKQATIQFPEDNLTIKITYFDFASQLASLLQRQIFNGGHYPVGRAPRQSLC